jgi:hypothetical protein
MTNDYFGSMRPHIEGYCDSLDAAIFTGDQFDSKPARGRLRWYMARWERELAAFDRADESQSPMEK